MMPAQAGSSPKLTPTDVMTYLKVVKTIFEDQTEKYDEGFQELKKDRTYNSHAVRDFSADRPNTEHDRLRRRAEKERKDNRYKRDFERGENDVEHDSKDLDGVQYKRNALKRDHDTGTEQLHQRVDGSGKYGMCSISASSFDDKNARKSQSLLAS